MSPQEIKSITDELYIPCLVGRQGFEKDIQQHVCKCFNGDCCSCYKKYKAHLESKKK